MIEVRDVNRYLAEDARQLVWDQSGVKPKDAIHLATAIKHHIATFDTFDEDLIQLDGKLGNPPMGIGTPNVSVSRARGDVCRIGFKTKAFVRR